MSNVAYLPGHGLDEASQSPKKPTRGPQVEDGYTKVANELLESVMAAPLTLREMRVVMAVIRVTYGWNRKQARLTGGLLAKLTGLPETIASKTLAGLIAKRVVLRLGGSRSPISLNKHAEEWELEAPKHVIPKAKPKSIESEQNAQSESEQNARPSKDKKDITTADAVVNAQSVRDAFEVFYNAGLPKKDRKRAERKFSALVKRDKRTPGELADFLANDIRKRLASEQQGFELLHPTTYLNNERWLDDYEPAAPVVGPGSDIPACPHGAILAEWDRHLAAKKGRAPAPVDWEGTRMAGKLEALWAKCWNAKNPSGAVRYDSVEAGVQWWSSVFKHLAGSRNFLQSDVTLSNLFNPDTFSLAVNGSLREQGGAVR